MATVKTIKPAGGGDYTTLQAWEDWADGEAAADQWAECYAGGDLGSVGLHGAWASTPSAGLYPKIYVAEGQGHEGDITAGAYSGGVFISALSYVQVVGLRITSASSDNVRISDSPTPIVGVVIQDCLSYNSAGNAGYYCYQGVTDRDVEAVFINCMSVNDPAGFYIGADFVFSGGHFIQAHCYNCTVYGATSYGFRMFNGAFDTGGGLDSGGKVLVENCIAMESGTADFINSTSGTAGPDSYLITNNCLSSDSTADDFGGSDNIIDETDTDVFTDPDGDDFSLKAGSAAFNAGKTIVSVTEDVAGTSRPQGASYDIGAFETEVAAARRIIIVS